MRVKTGDKSSKTVGGLEYSPSRIKRMRKTRKNFQKKYERLCGEVTVSYTEEKK